MSSINDLIMHQARAGLGVIFRMHFSMSYKSIIYMSAIERLGCTEHVSCMSYMYDE